MEFRPHNSRYSIWSFFRKNKKEESNTYPNERTALVSSPHPEDSVAHLHEPEDQDQPESQLVLWELWILFKASIPVVLAYALQNSLQTISVLIVGRLSPEALATAAFSYMFAMATGWLIALGGTTAIDTLASASFTGSKNRHDLGIILQRSFLVLALFYAPVAVLWICSEPVFRGLGQEDYIARDSARFLSVLVPGGLGYIYFEAMKKYLQALKELQPHEDLHPNHHIALHIPIFLKNFGPMHGWWMFPFERLIGILQKYRTNFKFGEFLSAYFMVLADQSCRRVGRNCFEEFLCYFSAEKYS